MAIAAPCFSGGKASSSEDCEIGTSAAPNRPCSTLNPTIAVMLVAMAQSTEATAKPLIATINRWRRPNCTCISVASMIETTSSGRFGTSRYEAVVVMGV